MIECEVRLARESDAASISAVILAALRTTNAKDYPASVIERVELSFSPGAILVFLAQRKVFVALADDHLVGTASLDGSVVRSVFVTPDAQGQGVGRQLMNELERSARETGAASLSVPSTVTAERFYSKLGFRAVGDSYHGDERTIIMERELDE